MCIWFRNDNAYREKELCMHLKPWEVDSRLKEDQLVEIGNIIKDVRNSTVELHDPDNGDGPWGLGCRVYDRTVNILAQKVFDYEWLELLRENLYFVILVNGVPIRYYKGTPETPPHRTLCKRLPEIYAEQCVFDFEESNRDWFWRLGVEPDNEQKVLQTTIAQLNKKGDFKNVWVIPTVEAVSPITFIHDIKPEPVVLESPAIGTKRSASKELKNGAEG